MRRSEILECLGRNVTSEFIDEVCLLLEDVVAPLDESKILTRNVRRRPTYGQLIGWANERILSESDVSIICNSDIYFDASLKALQHGLSANQCAALTRWDVNTRGVAKLFDRNDTQDSWVFRGRIRNLVDDFPIGIPRCDNRMLYELQRARYDVINPSFSVRSFHLHSGTRVEYDSKTITAFVAPPYRYLFPHNLYSPGRTLRHNLLNRGARVGWRVDWRWLGRSLPVRSVRKFVSMVPLMGQSSDVQ